MAQKPLALVYLFDGNDTLKQEMLLQRLTKRLAEKGDLTMNTEALTPKSIKDKAFLLSVLNILPFSSDYRFVVVREVDHLSKELQEALVDYVKDPSPTTVLALCADKLAKNNRLYKTIASGFPESLIDCSPKKRSELPQVIRNIAKVEGVDLSYNAASMLIDRLGSSTVTLSNEVKKLAAIAKAKGKNSISEQDIIKHVPRLSEPKQWDLTNALALRDASLCLKLIDRMKGYTASGLFIICVARIREILTAKVLRQRGLSVAKELNKQDWQIKELLRGVDLFTIGELESLILQAPEIELRMKTGGDADQLLKLWIIDACTSRKGSRT